jgi:hypothetical protein
VIRDTKINISGKSVLLLSILFFLYSRHWEIAGGTWIGNRVYLTLIANNYEGLIELHAAEITQKVFSVLSRRCLVVASNCGSSPFSVLLNRPRPQLPDSHTSQPQLSSDSITNHLTPFHWLNLHSHRHFATGDLAPFIWHWRQAHWGSRPESLFSIWTLAAIVVMKHPLWREMDLSRSRSYFTTDSQSVCLGIEHPCGTPDQILLPVGMLLFEICGHVSVGRPLWREDGSAICSVITQWSE